MRNERMLAVSNDNRQAPTRSSGGPMGWWYRIAAPPDAPDGASFADRERVRRGRLAAILLLGYIAVTLFAIPIGLSDPATLYSLIASYVVSAVMILLNRNGQVTITASILVIISDAVFALAILGAPHGLELIYVPLFDLMIIAELFAVSLLPPASVFAVAVANTGLILAFVFLLPHAANFPADSSPDYYTTIIRPIILHFIVAIVSYLWVNSSLNALRRADRAEEIAGLERREIEHTRAMERGVREVLATHVQLANGNFNARVPRLDEPLLWQIGSSLNNLINRFSRLAQAEFALRRTIEEARRLGEALRAVAEGRLPIWPAPSGTSIDELLPPLQALFSRGGNRPDAGLGVVQGAPGAVPPAQLAGGPTFGAPQIAAPGAFSSGGPTGQIGLPGGASMPGQWGNLPLDAQDLGRDPRQEENPVDALEAQLPEWLRGPHSRAPQSSGPQPQQPSQLTPLPRFGPQSQHNLQAYPYQGSPEYPTLDAEQGMARGDSPTQRNPYE